MRHSARYIAGVPEMAALLTVHWQGLAGHAQYAGLCAEWGTG